MSCYDHYTMKMNLKLKQTKEFPTLLVRKSEWRNEKTRWNYFSHERSPFICCLDIKVDKFSSFTAIFVKEPSTRYSKLEKIGKIFEWLKWVGNSARMHFTTKLHINYGTTLTFLRISRQFRKQCCKLLSVWKRQIIWDYEHALMIITNIRDWSTAKIEYTLLYKISQSENVALRYFNEVYDRSRLRLWCWKIWSVIIWIYLWQWQQWIIKSFS